VISGAALFLVQPHEIRGNPGQICQTGCFLKELLRHSPRELLGLGAYAKDKDTPTISNGTVNANLKRDEYQQMMKQ